MRLTKLVTVGLATAALAASGATADPGHGKGKATGQSSHCRPAPVFLAGTLADDPATGAASFQVTVKHANHLGQLYVKAGNPVTVSVDDHTRYRKAGADSTLDALAQGDRVLVLAKVCRADVRSAVKSNSALPDMTARLVLDKGQNPADPAAETNG
jgi:hypothetical protein